MNTRTRECEIDGTVYRTTVMPPDIGIPLAFRLAKLIGPATARAIEGIGEAAFGGRSEGLIGDAVRELVLAMPTEEDATKLIRELLVFTQTADGIPLVAGDSISDHFAGEYGRLRRVLEFVVKENKFLDFFGGWLSEILEGVGALRQTFRAASNEPPAPESSGSSGDQ